MKKIIATSKAPNAVGPYSQAVDTGSFLFWSGQISINPESNEVFLGDVREQTQMVLKNISAVLTEAGLTFNHVVKTTIFLKDMADFAAVNEIYATAFQGGSFPARSTVAVAGLPKGVSVEIEVIALRG